MHTSASPLSRNRWVQAIALCAWVFIGFAVAQLVIIGILFSLRWAGVEFAGINPSLLNSVISVAVYALTIAILIGVPWRLRNIRTSQEDIGLTRLPDWQDILLAPAGFVIYLLISGVLAYAAIQLFPGFNAEQSQDVGFQDLAGRYEYLLAFISLVVVAPIAEEIFVRGYLYGKLRKRIPIWAAVLFTSLVFGILHGQWNVGLDVFALSLILCSLREVTGNIWAGILLHMIKNGVGFYFLFINSAFLSTIGG